MPSGITGRDGFLPALVKSIRRSFPCRHPTTGGSLKGTPAGTPLTHRFFVLPVLYHRCGGLSTLFLPRAATRRETGRSQRGICICVLVQRKIAVWVAKKPDIIGLFAGDIFLSPHYGGPEGIRTLDLSDANRTLSQLSYKPVFTCVPCYYTHFPQKSKRNFCASRIIS